MHYELSSLRDGWRETSTAEADQAIAALQEFTGWDAEACEEAIAEASCKLAEAEHRYLQEKAQAFYDEHGRYPSGQINFSCKVELNGYTVTRRRVKTRHVSESSRLLYSWSK